MNNKKYDLLIIGGGPAGIITAYFAAKNGKSVLLLEKKSELGKKLLITGKGRCNITNNSINEREFSAKFGKNGKFLLNGLYSFSPHQVSAFFNNIGVEVITERGGRVFPKNGNAKTVRDTLVKLLKKSGIDILTSTSVTDIKFKDDEISSVSTNKQSFTADNYLIATGGLSFPETGSTGDGYKFLKKLKIKIIDTYPALTPLITEENWTKDVKNFNLKNIEISLFIDNKKVNSKFGEAFFTFNGIGGPIVLDLSKQAIIALKQNKKVHLILNMKPAVDKKEFENRIIKLSEELRKEPIINLLRKILPKDMSNLFINLHIENKNIKCAELSKKLRKQLLNFITELKLTVTGNEGYKKAIITSGGVDLKEIDSKTMRIKKYKNLFVAGEVLDLDAPTGGYNMQACWSSGFLVGNNL